MPTELAPSRCAFKSCWRWHSSAAALLASYRPHEGRQKQKAPVLLRTAKGKRQRCFLLSEFLSILPLLAGDGGRSHASQLTTWQSLAKEIVRMARVHLSGRITTARCNNNPHPLQIGTHTLNIQQGLVHPG